MHRHKKIATGVSALLLGLLYVVPLWWIKLDAPQYPEGLGLYIGIDRIRGENKNDLQTINGLNHYIGMKRITPESIPELRIMPYIVAFLIVAGLGAAVSGKRILLMIWLALFFLVLAAGLTDFYLWEYDYGHDLNPHAPLKIPGMSYQPPLIGSKQLLNMRTTSVPYLGAVAAIMSFAIGVLVLVADIRQRRKMKDRP